MENQTFNRTRIVELIQTVAGRPVNPSPDESLFESGLLDSFTLTDLVAAIERDFSIRIPDSDLTPRKFDSVTRINAYIVANLQSKS
jgi:acyl carrier protein